MITHKAFADRLMSSMSRAGLEIGAGQHIEALLTLENAIQEIEVHTRRTVTKTPELLRMERTIFRQAYQLQKTLGRN